MKTESKYPVDAFEHTNTKYETTHVCQISFMLLFSSHLLALLRPTHRAILLATERRLSDVRTTAVKVLDGRSQ